MTTPIIIPTREAKKHKKLIWILIISFIVIVGGLVLLIFSWQMFLKYFG